MELTKTLRWFGEKDPISLKEIAQTGATGIVTALHHIPNGEVWSVDEILKTKNNIESHGLTWDVVESLPVHEDIKKGSPNREKLIANYKQSIKNLGACGVKIICYNFMPVLDWARTNIQYVLENGAEAMYFDKNLFSAFDLFLLKRPNAEKDYTEQEIKEAKIIFDRLSEEEKDKLGYNIIVKTQSFIDGAVKEGEKNYLNIFNELLAAYNGIDKNKLRDNFSYFLNEVIEVAEESGVCLAVHPDDPPFPLLGLPRIVSCDEDFEWLAKACPSLNNGITFCSGSLGARTDNNLSSIFKKHASRVHFLHLRSTKLLSNGDFYETNHLEGSITSLMKAIVEEQINRKQNGRLDFNIPMRPDHGHKILNDFERESNPGYPLIGRVKGLAELSGLELGMKYLLENKSH
ncbi:mannonate dehydratase [Thalassobellus suaedae]|uniref:Mannonate dehydratase n=1 Tax=Thalassobellus suaedae TaxID=3074124 RepID=A0ABY9XXT3_9FLAO|nr:mannonate dehydratase [Flavobacteriaceae bacterium HL-DH14]